MTTSFIYIVGPSDNPVKIGYADDVAKRVSQLQIGCPDELIVHKAIPVRRYLAAGIESAAHTCLSEFHRRGEWFNVTATKAAEIVAVILERYEAGLEDEIARRGIGDDSFAKLTLREAIHRDAWEAISFYLSERNVRRAAKAVKIMNAMIAQEAGPAGLALYQSVFVENKSIDYMVYNERGTVKAGYALLARAVNALAAYYAYRKKKLLASQPRYDFMPPCPGTPEALREETRRRRLASQTAAVAKKPAA